MRHITALISVCLCLAGCGSPTPPIPKIIDQSGVDPLVQKVINEQISSIEKKPRDSNKWLVLGHLFFAHGYESEAVRAYQAAGELDPKMSLAHVLRGVALQRQGDREAAMSALRAAQRANPLVAHHYWLPGLWALQAGDFEQAKTLADMAIRTSSQDVEANRLKSQIALQSGDIDTALVHARKAASTRPADRGIRSELAVVLRAAGKLELAAKQRAFAGEADPNWPNPSVQIMGRHRTDLKIWTQRILNYANNEKVEAARNDLLRIKPYYEGQPYYELSRAVILVKEGKRRSGIEILTSILDESPDWIDARVNRGLAYLELGGLDSIEAAQEDFEKAVLLDPRNVGVLENLARISSMTKDAESLFDFYRKIIEIEPFIRRHRNVLAMEQLKAARFQDALATLDEAKDRYGDEGPVPLTIRARSYIELKRFDDADECVLALQARSPNYPSIGQLRDAISGKRP